MSDKTLINRDAVYISKKININNTVRLTENMSSINEIIFHKVTPTITECNVFTSNTYIRGNCSVDIIYIGESMNADRINFQMPFETNEPTDCDKGTFWGDCVVDSVEITPIKGRRCDISINILITGYLLAADEINTDFNTDEHIKIYKDEKKKKVSTVEKINKTDSMEYIHASGFSDEVRIVYSNAEVYDIQTNHSAAGILINGTLRKNIIYSRRNNDDSFSYYVIDENVSFNQFCEVSYSVKFNDYSVSCKASSAEVYQQNNDDECKIILNVTISSDICLINTFELSDINDIFSPEYDLKCEFNIKKSIAISRVATKDVILNFNDNTGLREGSKILTGNENADIILVTTADHISAKLNAYSDCVVLIDNSTLKTVKTQVSKNIEIPFSTIDDAQYFAKCKLIDTTRQLNGGYVNINCKICIEIYEICCVSVSEITSYTLDARNDEVTDYITVRIHYPDAAENIFKIAKENKRSLEDITSLRNNASDNSPVIVWEKLI
ncbi:MAG: DUF3794 domain-containing protein [Anaerofustis stercorihominis]|nr:DUF3794 domain-containing protein [Anaerofustis stercorihominis]